MKWRVRISKLDHKYIYYPICDGEITAVVDPGTALNSLINIPDETKYVYFFDIELYMRIIETYESTSEHFVNTITDLY